MKKLISRKINRPTEGKIVGHIRDKRILLWNPYFILDFIRGELHEGYICDFDEWEDESDIKVL